MLHSHDDEHAGVGLQGCKLHSGTALKELAGPVCRRSLPLHLTPVLIYQSDIHSQAAPFPQGGGRHCWFTLPHPSPLPPSTCTQHTWDITHTGPPTRGTTCQAARATRPQHAQHSCLQAIPMHGMHATIGDAFTCICAQGLLLGRAHAPDSLGAQVNNMPASPVLCGSVSNLIAPYDAPSFHPLTNLLCCCWSTHFGGVSKSTRWVVSKRG